MSLLSRIKKAAKAFNEDEHKNITTPWSRKEEDEFLSEIMSEIEAGERREGPWARAIMNSNGDSDLAESLYIQYAVQSLIDDEIIEEVERKEEIEESARRFRMALVFIFALGLLFYYLSQNY